LRCESVVFETLLSKDFDRSVFHFSPSVSEALSNDEGYLKKFKVHRTSVCGPKIFESWGEKDLGNLPSKSSKGFARA
jgi:hypothetical protein